MSGLMLTLLGPPRLSRGGETVHLRSRKCMALLAYLAVTDAAQSRAVLQALLWPESDAPHAQTVLRTTLSLLRAGLNDEWLVADRETVGLDSTHRSTVDVVRFRDLLATCRSHDHPTGVMCPHCLPLLAEAVELHQDDFMGGFTLRDSPQFDAWQTLEGQALRDELAAALQQLVEWHATASDLETAIDYANRWLALDPLREEAHRSLMQLYASAGRLSAALQQYQACQDALSEALDVSPSEETAELYRALKAGETPEDRSNPADVWVLPPRPRHNLPQDPTPFIGREEEIAQIAQRLADPNCRLLTIVGPGGIGKSRLAIRAARDQLDHALHDVYLVPLAPVSSAELLPSAIMSALKAPLAGASEPQLQLINYLREKKMLLLLDNFEHLLEGTSLVSRILAEAAGVSLLVTSRERLNLRQEWLLPLRGMGYPLDGTLAEASAPASTERYDALRLFVQCVQRLRPEFRPAGTDLLSVARICQLVDGMPLAIELAAAWAHVMPPQEIAREIARNLGFLATAARDVPPRQRSIRATFDHSWRLSSPEEREVLAQLSVFRGGFRREAAEAVAGASLRRLSALVDRSWLRVLPSGRYEMHELIRQYCAERLQAGASADDGEARDRHSAYYGAFCAEREARLLGSDQVRVLQEVLEDMDNVRAAWRWAVERGDVETIGGCSLTFWYVAETVGWYHEMHQAYNAAIPELRRRLAQPQVDATVWAQTAFVLANVCHKQAEMCVKTVGLGGRAQSLCEEGLALLQRLERSDQRDLLTVGLDVTLGHILRRSREAALGKQLHEEALALAEQVGDPFHQEAALWSLGIHARHEGQYVEAADYFERAIALAEGVGELWFRGLCTESLAWVLCARGQYDRAERLAEESLRLREELGDRSWMGYSLRCLGSVATAVRQYERAAELYRLGHVIAEETASLVMRTELLNQEGALALEMGKPEEARVRYQAALSLTRETDNYAMEIDSLVGLGHAAIALGESQQARNYLLQGLEGAMGVDRLPAALDALLGFASLASHDGDAEQAVKLSNLVLHHPATFQIHRDRAQTMLEELEAGLKPEAFSAAVDRGRALSLADVASETLSQPPDGNQWRPQKDSQADNVSF